MSIQLFQTLQQAIETFWTRPIWQRVPLIPLSWVWMLLVFIRRRCYQLGLLRQITFKIPVIVIGNLNLGGSGKTPLVVYIAHKLQERGLKIGIISRGYKGHHQKPTFVDAASDPGVVGDEPLMMYQSLQCPLVVGKDRVAALKTLLEKQPVDVVLADDGLQHYALARTIEIVVIPPNLVNTDCLPAGPLREPLSRLKTVDLIVYNRPSTSRDVIASIGKQPRSMQKEGCYDMHYQPDCLYNAVDPTQQQALETLKGMKVHAVAGLGNPAQFFSMLQTTGLTIIPHRYPDHHAYVSKDILFNDELPVILTEKDFVKCKSFVQNVHWVLPIHAHLSEGFEQALWTLLQEHSHG